MMFHFLWAGNISQHKWHLAAWDLLAKPKCLGGWGIKDLSLFNSALCAKSLWWVLFDPGLWSGIVKAKYLHRLPSVYWIRSCKSICPGASLVWRSLIKSLPFIQQLLCWTIGRGTSVYLGIDPISGLDDDFRFSDALLLALHACGILVLKQVWSSTAFSGGAWHTAEELHLQGALTVEWNTFVKNLSCAGIHLTLDEDVLSWIYNEHTGAVTAQLAYSCLMDEKVGGTFGWWTKFIWKPQIPLKICCFTCLAIHNRILTWSNLQRRGILGPGICLLCRGTTEDISHLFGSCPCFQRVWDVILSIFMMKLTWKASSLDANLFQWFSNKPKYPNLILFILWGIWCAQNSILFWDITILVNIIAACISANFWEYYHPPKFRLTKSGTFQEDTFPFPLGYFDSAEQFGMCGASAVLKLNHSHSFHLYVRVGMGTNTRAELLALWTLLWFTNRMQVHSLHVFGDSMSIVDWAAGKCEPRSLPLHHWIVCTHRLIGDFDQIFFKHIYRSFNTLADDLSKHVLLGMMACCSLRNIWTIPLLVSSNFMCSDSILFKSWCLSSFLSFYICYAECLMVIRSLLSSLTRFVPDLALFRLIVRTKCYVWLPAFCLMIS